MVQATVTDNHSLNVVLASYLNVVINGAGRSRSFLPHSYS